MQHNWSEEYFTVDDKIPRNPPVYRLKDLKNRKLKGNILRETTTNCSSKRDLSDIQCVEKERKQGIGQLAGGGPSSRF